MIEKYMKEDLVIIDYNDLLQENNDVLLFRLLRKAFGKDSLGAIAIRNVPNFVQWKKVCLPMSHTLANLDPGYLEEHLTDASSMYNAGWSRGKEAALSGGYGSFYYNPITDKPGTEEDRNLYPASYPCNKWPSEDILPGFQEATKTLGTIMKEATVLLSKHIDAYAQHHCPQYPHLLLYNSMKDTDKVKGRLLYYYPHSGTNHNGDTTKKWIGWHNDSGFLTALAGDLYVNHETGQQVNFDDSDAGLFIKNRKGEIIKAMIPFDCMAVQIGECVQIITGGAVQATSHCVQGSPEVARISHPCFVDVPPSFPLSLPPGSNREEAIEVDATVPPLSSRWTHDGMTFGNFLQTTFEQYYKWSPKSN